MEKYSETMGPQRVMGVKEESWDSGLLGCHSKREGT